VAKPRVQKALQKAYQGRKTKKRDMRSMWIQQVNAAARLYGVKYSDMICGLSKNNVEIDRKILSQLAMFEPYSFRALTKVVIEHAGVKPSFDARIIVQKKSTHDLT
jgi:large subunit ribosomal protein L20